MLVITSALYQRGLSASNAQFSPSAECAVYVHNTGFSNPSRLSCAFSSGNRNALLIRLISPDIWKNGITIGSVYTHRFGSTSRGPCSQRHARLNWFFRSTSQPAQCICCSTYSTRLPSCAHQREKRCLRVGRAPQSCVDSTTISWP